MKEVNLRQGRYSPFENPFLNKSEFCIGNQTIKTHITQQKSIDPNSNETANIATILITEKEDKKSFIKIFAAGVQAIFNLSRTGYRALILALQIYHANQSNHDGSITLIWYDGGVNGQKLDMTDRTFYIGIKELINKKILQPKLPNQYWMNPAIFFKGNKITFIKEYQINSSPTKTKEKTNQVQQDLPDDGYQTDIEDFTNK
ncbi:hypothetical protein [Bartonella melophagi]|uniref:Plasmid replication protein RepL domain-containing protein n=1 Tax=Bartonella melophagi K-2C TaxID=1094557 RepID=J1JT34_9HYPH|nr:hypothetical protein [Bartonella melophagi]EJF87630.1 hypothetical protein ME3_01334 [Bartonella melophagi K-2C]